MPLRSAEVADAPALAALVHGHPLFERYGLLRADLGTSVARAVERGDHVWMDVGENGPKDFACWTPT